MDVGQSKWNFDLVQAGEFGFGYEQVNLGLVQASGIWV